MGEGSLLIPGLFRKGVGNPEVASRKNPRVPSVDASGSPVSTGRTVHLLLAGGIEPKDPPALQWLLAAEVGQLFGDCSRG